MKRVTLPDGLFIQYEYQGNCLVIETSGWIAHVYKDGYRLLPPPAWLLDLIKLIDTGVIHQNRAKDVLEFWRQDTCAQIAGGMAKLQALIEQNETPVVNPNT